MGRLTLAAVAFWLYTQLSPRETHFEQAAGKLRCCQPLRDLVAGGKEGLTWGSTITFALPQSASFTGVGGLQSLPAQELDWLAVWFLMRLNCRHVVDIWSGPSILVLSQRKDNTRQLQANEQTQERAQTGQCRDVPSRSKGQSNDFPSLAENPCGPHPQYSNQ
jgi:hypothetical protein